jgi:RNA polymerase sigma factor (sigma-70 family)
MRLLDHMFQRLQICSPDYIFNFQLFSSGNEKGFTFLYKKLYRPSFYFASRLLNDNLDIDCIVQDAFLYAWTRRDRLKNVSHLFFSIKLFIKYRCIRYRKYNWQRNSIYIDVNKIEQSFCCYLENENSNHSEGYAEELFTLLENAMSYLPATRKNVIILYKKGLSVNRISKHLGVSSQRVTSELKKGIASLKLIFPTLQKAYQASKKKKALPVGNFEAYLNERQTNICILYYINEQPFSTISRQLGLTPFEILKEHYAAMNILNSVKNKKL